MERYEKKKINWRFKKLEYKLMEEYLEEMAVKGWMLSEISNNKATFASTNPRHLKFCVSIPPYTSTSIHDADDGMIDEYRSSCESLGWHYITSYDQMYFFYAEKYENTYSVHTDPESEQRLIINKVWKKELFKSTGIFIYFIFITWINFFTKGYFDYKILVNWFASLTMFVLLPLAFIFSIAPVISNLIWYFKTKFTLNNYANSKSLKFVKTRNFLFDLASYILMISLASIIMYYFMSKITHKWTESLLIILILAIIVCGFCFYKKFKEQRGTIKILSVIIIFFGITICVYVTADNSLNRNINNTGEDIQTVSYEYPVIRISDFANIDKIDSNSFSKSYSPLVPKGYIYSEDYDDEEQNYDATTEYYKCINSKVASILYDGIISYYENRKYFKRKTENLYAKNWNCDEATLIHNDILLLLRGNEVIKIEISDDLINIYDEKFRQKILEKFINYI